MVEDTPQGSPISRERDWMAALLMRQQSRLIPRFAVALARLRSLSRGQRRRLQRRAAATLAGAALVLAIGAANFGPLGVGVAQAATISVANGEIAVNDNGVCSLIEAIINAEDDAQTHDDCIAGAGADVIDLPVGGSFTFSVPYVYDAGENGLPTIDTTLTIAGNGSTLDLGGPAVPMRLAQISATGDLTINATTIGNGLMIAATYGGGALRVDGGALTIDGSTLADNITTAYGGAVFARNAATLTITNSTLSGNRAFRGGAVMGHDSAVTVTDSAIDGNVAKRSGGGLQIESGSLTLTRGTVNDNGWEPGQIGVAGYVDYAGGINAESATVSITGTEIDGNFGGYFGGGVLLADVTGATISGATITGNTAGDGGGVAWGRFGDGGIYPTTGVIRDSIIDGNTALYSGGGVAQLVGALRIERTTISNNVADGGNGYAVGGGVTNLGGDLTIVQSALAGNTAEAAGGGLYFTEAIGNGVTVVTNTTISGNNASQGGGVSLRYGAPATFNNVTISDNEADEGGGLHVYNNAGYAGQGGATLNRTIISGNRADTSGDEVFVRAAPITANNVNLFGHGGITTAQAIDGVFVPGATDITATSNGTTPTALAGILAPLAANGGPTTPPTKTHALVSNSPALDRAPNTACVAPSPTDGVDQRDVARNQNGSGAAGSNECDIGAYEYVALGNICPAPANQLTTILGVGMGNAKTVRLQAKVVIPNSANLIALYGQMVGKQQGPGTRYVRFIYPNNTYVQVGSVTSPAPQQAGEFWYGTALNPAANIRGRWFLNAGKAKSPRALLLYATHQTPATYFNTYALFDDGATNQVAGPATWPKVQTFIIPIDPPTGPADVRVQVALVDNDKDARAITVSAAAGAATDSDVATGPTHGPTLSIINLTLDDVAATTSQVVITLQTDEQGDSAAVVGAVVNYACQPTG